MANITQIVSSTAKTWIKGSKSVVTTPKTVNVQELISGLNRGTGSKTMAIGDSVQLSLKKFMPPTEAEVKSLLAKHSISGNSFHCGDVLLSKPFVNHNNEIFLKRLDELYPAIKGKKTYEIEDILVCLEDINHTNFKDKESFLQQFIRDLDDIKRMTDKSGNALFDQGITSLYSKKAIIQAKYNKPERYQDIIDLYNLVKQGKAPDYILKGLIPEGEFHALARGDIRKLAQGKNYFEQFNSTTTSSEILAKTQLGDAFSIGDKMFVRSANGYEELSLSKSMYERLFPPIERYAMAQTENSCHFVATLDGAIKNPETRVNLYKMFTQTGEQTVRIKLPGQDTIPMNFDLRSLDYLDTNYLQGALGHKMIEHTVGLNFNRTTRELNKSVLLHINNGGNPDLLAIPLLFGREATKLCACIPHAAKRNLLNESAGNLLTVLRAENDKAKKGYLPSVVNRNIGFTGAHVYSSQAGKLSNPWNTIEMLPFPEIECKNIYAVYI